MMFVHVCVLHVYLESFISSCTFVKKTQLADYFCAFIVKSLSSANSLVIKPSSILTCTGNK